MHLTHTDAQRLELALAERAATGDREAFASLYERYVQGIYDFALRIVRDPDAAADVAQVTFVKAWERLSGRKRPTNVKAWLYAVAHNAAIDELRRRKRLVPLAAGEPSEAVGNPLAQLDPSRLSNPEAVVGDQALVDLVWESAAALSPREYALLDLNVRQDLGADELAEALGIRKGAVYTMLSRLRASLEESVTSVLLMRRGRRDCAELDALVTTIGAEATPDARKAVQRHLQACPRCQESKRRFVSPIEIFGAIAPVPLLPALQGAIWNNVTSHVEAGASAGGAPGAGALGGLAQLPGQWWAGATLATKAIVAGAATAVVAGVIAAAVVLSGGGGAVVEDPDDVHSVSHEVGVASDDNIVRIAWSAQEDVQGYSVRWSQAPDDLPDETADLPGDATSALSPPLPPGDWYFHLRTQAESGDWTSTVHLGPFVITALVVAPPDETDQPPAAPTDEASSPTDGPPTPAPTDTPQRTSGVAGVAVTPTATPTATDTDTPTPVSAPTATPHRPTPTDTPTPTRTPTPRPTATPTPTPTRTPTPTNTPRPTPTPTTPRPIPTFKEPPRPVTPINDLPVHDEPAQRSQA